MGAFQLLGDTTLPDRLWAGCTAAQHSTGMALQPTLHVPILAGNTNMLLPSLHKDRLVNGKP